MLRTRTNDEVLVLKLVIGEDVIFDEHEYYGSVYRVKNHSYNDIHNYDIIKIEETFYYKKYSGDYNTLYQTMDETGLLESLELMNEGEGVVFFILHIISLVNVSYVDDLVRVTPTDVRLIEDQNKLQLQLEHDTQVLSIDEGVNDLLGSKFGYDITQYIQDDDEYIGELYLENSDGAFMIIRGTLSTSTPVYNLEGTILSLIGNEISSLFGNYIEEPNGTSGTIAYISGLLALDSTSTITPSEWSITSFNLVNRITGQKFTL